MDKPAACVVMPCSRLYGANGFSIAGMHGRFLFLEVAACYKRDAAAYKKLVFFGEFVCNAFACVFSVPRFLRLLRRFR